jgi:hypothetical protein
MIFCAAMNDRWTYEDEGRKNGTLLLTTERILRLARRHQVAVLYLSTFMGAVSACDEAYDAVCARLGVPLLSYRSLVLQQVRHAFSLPTHDPCVHVNRTRSPVFFNTIFIEDLHPMFQSHVIIAQFVCDFFEKAFSFYTHESHRPQREEAGRRWSRVGEGEGEEGAEEGSLVDQHTSCHPIQSFYSSLPSDQPFVTNKMFHKSTEAVGWKYKVDHPGKPYGWVSEGNRTFGKLLFPVVLLNGQVTVTYLKSYRNCGKFQLFFQPSKFLSGNFEKSSPMKLHEHPNLIPCCRNPWQTFSADIDTFDNTPMTSVIVSRTFQFDMIGLLNVVVYRVPLSTEETAHRSGDKVKILSLRTC